MQEEIEKNFVNRKISLGRESVAKSREFIYNEIIGKNAPDRGENHAAGEVLCALACGHTKEDTP